MLVFGTEMHVITFVFLILEIPMFFYQGVYFLSRPQDKQRFWYLLLLFLLIAYNITGGLFPDHEIRSISVIHQNIIAYGTGFLMASYFPYYFYKGMGLDNLKFIALYGVPLFLLLPYFAFFVIAYSINGDLDFAIRYGVIIPFIYSFVAAWGIFHAIRIKYKQQPKDYTEIIGVYLAVLPWASMTVISYFKVGQATEALFANVGFVVITLLFISRSIKKARKEYDELIRLGRENSSFFESNCLSYRLTKREIEIAMLIQQGFTYKKVAEALFISEKTVGNHIQNLFIKVAVKNKTELTHKLLSPE